MLKYILIGSALISGCGAEPNAAQLAPACTLSPEIGPCRALIPKYYFDQKSQSCQQFGWGGCRGQVPFDTKQDCLSQCTTTSKITVLDILKKSQSTWLQLKAQHENNYNYSRVFSSWVGFGHKTTISVVKDKVTRREYQAWGNENNNTLHWQEDTNTLNSHPEGASSSTMDQLYQQCALILENNDKPENKITLNFDQQGILAHCLFTPNNCADDCSQGISISDFRFL